MWQVDAAAHHQSHRRAARLRPYHGRRRSVGARRVRARGGAVAPAPSDRDGVAAAEPAAALGARQRPVQPSAPRSGSGALGVGERRGARAQPASGPAVGRGQGPTRHQRNRALARGAAKAVHRAAPSGEARDSVDGRAVLGARPRRHRRDRRADLGAARHLHHPDRDAQHGAGAPRFGRVRLHAARARGRASAHRRSLRHAAPTRDRGLHRRPLRVTMDITFAGCLPHPSRPR